jgi:hypothetical protein
LEVRILFVYHLYALLTLLGGGSGAPTNAEEAGAMNDQLMYVSIVCKFKTRWSAISPMNILMSKAFDPTIICRHHLHVSLQKVQHGKRISWHAQSPGAHNPLDRHNLRTHATAKIQMRNLVEGANTTQGMSSDEVDKLQTLLTSPQKLPRSAPRSSCSFQLVLSSFPALYTNDNHNGHFTQR